MAILTSPLLTNRISALLRCSAALGATAFVVVAHPLRIAHPLHVVDRDLQLLAEPARPRRAADPTPGPFTITGHQDHGDLGHAGLGFDERLHPRAGACPVVQIAMIRGGPHLEPKLPIAPQSVEESQRLCLLIPRSR